MNNIYDFIVIGAGISACTFSSFLNKRFSDASILLVDQGRRIGGRATTRKSRKNKNLEFDHGLPAMEFSNPLSYEIQELISPLIHSKKLLDISNDILIINEYGQINNALTKNKIYRSSPFAINFCEEIINQSTRPKKLNFLFKTLIKSIKRINNIWEIKVNEESSIQTQNLILSSSLIAHPRCLKTLNTKSLPLRDALKLGEDAVVDSVLRETSKQNFIKRKIYILYVSNNELVRNLDQKYLQIFFSIKIRNDYNFERIIFQKQSDGSMVIVLHCYYINKLVEINIDEIIKSLVSIFLQYQIFVDLFSEARLIDKMDWRASQPLNNLLPRELQWSSISNIGFCGDWFDSKNCGGVESAILSSIRLAKFLIW